jgi:hypothetical protein
VAKDSSQNSSSIFGALVRTIFVSRPQVAIYDAQTFFHNYYENVTNSSQRKMLYQRSDVGFPALSGTRLGKL